MRSHAAPRKRGWWLLLAFAACAQGCQFLQNEFWVY
jgi:hypothetical protein